MGKIVARTEDRVGIISLNRPERHNALDDEAVDELRAAFAAALADDAIRAILLRGEGRSFSSGRDTSQLGRRANGESDFAFVQKHQRDRLAILESPKPVVAAVKGVALGGGCELALSADIRVGSTDLKMALPEINYGLLPDTGGTLMLANLIGPSRAKYMALTGERIDAETAFAWGAVDFLVAPEDLDARAFAIARSLAAKPPIALAMGKQIIDHGHLPAVRTALSQELLGQTALFASADYAEARAAHREARAPDYRGR